MKKETNEEENLFGGFNYMDSMPPTINTTGDDDLSEEEVKALENEAKKLSSEDEDKDSDVSDKAKDVKEKKQNKKAPVEEEVEEEEEEEEYEEAASNSSNVEEEEEEDDDEDNGIGGFASYMNERGLLHLEEGEKVKDEEDLERVLSNTIKAEVDKYKQSVGEDGMHFLNYIENGGNPRDFLFQYYGNHSFEDLDIDDENAQKFVIRESLRLEGYDEDDIDDEITLYEDGDKLEARAKKHLKKLQKLEEEKKEQMLKAQEQQAKEYQQRVKDSWDNLKNGLYNSEEIAGFKFTKKMKDELWQYMSKPNPKTGRTAYQEDEAESKEARYIYAYLMKNKWDIKSLEKHVENKVVGKLSKKLNGYSDSRRKVKTPRSDFQKDTLNNPFKGFGDVM